MGTTLQCHVFTPLWGWGQLFSVMSLHCEDVDKSSVSCINTTVRMWTSLQCHVFTLWGCGQVFSVMSLHCQDVNKSSVPCLYTVRMWTSLQCHVFTLWGCGQVFSVMSLNCEDVGKSSVPFLSNTVGTNTLCHIFTWLWGQAFSVASLHHCQDKPSVSWHNPSVSSL